MDLMPKAEPVIWERAQALDARDQEVEKCHLDSMDPLSSSAFKETVETLAKMRGHSSNSEAVASEEVGCSMESDASSNAMSGESLVSDADSVAPCEEKNLKRSPSGGSIVTYDGAASKIPEEGVCERTSERKLVRRSKGSESNSFYDEQEHSITTALMMAESTGPAWTDDKHCSYLNSIEATFVQSLYGPDFNLSGQEDQDCVESRPMYSSYGYPHDYELFISFQRGCYGQREYYRPQFLHNFAPAAPAVFLSPWVQHFNPKSHPPSHAATAPACHDPCTSNTPTGLAEEACGRSVEDEGVKEEVMESLPDLNEVPVVESCNYRSQSQHFASTSTAVRADTGHPAKKRHLDPSSDVAYRTKKSKSTFRSLAEIDLEMEEQFLQEQKLLEEQGSHPDWREEKRRLDVAGVAKNAEFITSCKKPLECQTANLAGLRSDTKKVTDLPDDRQYGSVVPLGVQNSDLKDLVVKKSTVDAGDRLISPVSPVVVSHDEVKSGKGTDVPHTHQCDTASLPRDERTSEGEVLATKKVVTDGHKTPPMYHSKIFQEENTKQLPSLGLEEEEQCEYLSRRSPRASRTYTWGSIGTRRMLKEHSVFQEPAVLSARVKDVRGDELPNMEQHDRNVFKS